MHVSGNPTGPMALHACPLRHPATAPHPVQHACVNPAARPGGEPSLTPLPIPAVRHPD